MKAQKTREWESATSEAGQAITTKYRAIAARALALGRSDIQFAVKEIARKVSSPDTEDWTTLERFADYLRGRPRAEN